MARAEREIISTRPRRSRILEAERPDLVKITHGAFALLETMRTTPHLENFTAGNAAEMMEVDENERAHINTWISRLVKAGLLERNEQGGFRVTWEGMDFEDPSTLEEVPPEERLYEDPLLRPPMGFNFDDEK